MGDVMAWLVTRRGKDPLKVVRQVDCGKRGERTTRKKAPR
jgi:hypothetical protein